VRSLQEELRDLPYGAGAWRGSEVGEAARAKLDAGRQHQQADDFAHSGGSLRTRHHWRNNARVWAAVEAQETQRFDEIAAPIRERLEADLSTAEILMGHLEGRVPEREQWLEQHPELEVRVAAIDRDLDPTPTIEQQFHALQIEEHCRDLGIGLER
jgi:hypothetical protein